MPVNRFFVQWCAGKVEFRGVQSLLIGWWMEEPDWHVKKMSKGFYQDVVWC